MNILYLEFLKRSQRNQYITTKMFYLYDPLLFY